MHDTSISIRQYRPEETSATREEVRPERHRAKLEDTVDSIATTAVLTCGPSDTLEEAARLMWEQDCGALPVVDSAGKVVGVITDRDALMAAYTRGVGLHAPTVESVMSKTLYSCRPEESIGRALELMELHKVRRLPVVSKTGHLLGLVSLADAVRRLEHTPPTSAHVVRTLVAVCEPQKVNAQPS